VHQCITRGVTFPVFHASTCSSIDDLRNVDAKEVGVESMI